MLRKEIIDLINNHGDIFRYKYYEGNDVTCNYSDFIQLLRTEKNYWAKLDKKNAIQNGYSVTYNDLINYLEELVHCDDETVFQTPETILHHFYSNINDSERIQIKNYSYGTKCLQINMCPNRSSVNYKLVNAYKDLIDSDQERVFNIVLSLYEERNSIGQLLSSNRNTDEYKGAIYYLGLETKNIKRTSEYTNQDEKYNELSSRYDELQKRGVAFEQDINDYSSEFKQHEEEWLRDQNDLLIKFRNEHNEKLDELEAIYDEKLKLSEPVKFWEEQAENRKKQFYYSFGIVTFLTILVLGAGSVLVEILYKYAIDNNVISRIVPLSFVIIGIITLLMYLLNVAIKIMLSAKHLQTVYEQKAIFTYFFLTMIKEDNTQIPISNDEKSLVYQTLFSSPDTGLLKNGNDASDVTSLLNTVLSRMTKGN